MTNEQYIKKRHFYINRLYDLAVKALVSNDKEKELLTVEAKVFIKAIFRLDRLRLNEMFKYIE